MTKERIEVLSLVLEALKELVEKFDSEQFTSICELDKAKEAIEAAEKALANHIPDAKNMVAQPSVASEQLKGLQLIHKADIDLTNKHATEAQPAVSKTHKRKPLTQAEVVEGFCKQPHDVQFVSVFDAGVRFAEAAHGITSKE